MATALTSGLMVNPKVRLVRKLGEGGMGSVWLARHLSLDTSVAVKFINPDIIKRGASTLERFEREAKAAAKIRSPHIVQVFDHGTMEDGTPYIVMEVLDGEDLGSYLERNGSLQPKETMAIVRHVAKALTEAHSHGIVHRDIKPDNLFLAKSAGELHVKVLDFGIAKHTAVPTATRLTGSQMILGTPEFMSPEQVLSAKDVNLWALAVVVYVALAGQMPFRGETIGSLIVAITELDYTNASQLSPVCSDGVDAWFSRAFAREPEKRFGSANEFVTELARVLTPDDSAVNSQPISLIIAPTRPQEPVGHDVKTQSGNFTRAASIALPMRNSGRTLLIAGVAVIVTAGVSYALLRDGGTAASSSVERRDDVGSAAVTPRTGDSSAAAVGTEGASSKARATSSAPSEAGSDANESENVASPAASSAASVVSASPAATRKAPHLPAPIPEPKKKREALGF